MDYPPELSSPDLVGALVQHTDEDQVIGLRIDACLNHGDPASWSSFLRSSGLVERETLNHVASATTQGSASGKRRSILVVRVFTLCWTAAVELARYYSSLCCVSRSGACQFSAVADQLFRSRPVTESFRPDVYLRLLALHCVSHNQNAFQDFMLHAAPVTRRQRQRGGGGVDMEEYARRMTSSRCDGDHITLQALCDALKVNINVVKWTRDDGWYPRTVASATTNDAASASNPPAAVAEEPRRPSRSVFVADTLRPRAVASLDARARDLQLQGRTLWLSLHGEAHFRSLRVRDPVTEAEAAALGRAGDSTGSAGGGGDASGGGGGRSSSASPSSSSSSSLSSPPMAGRTSSSSSSSSSSSCSSSPPPSSSSQGRGGRSSPRLRSSSSRSRLPGGCGPGGGDGEASAASAAPAASPKGSATAGDSGSASGPAAPDEACREGRREEQQASSATDGAGSRDVVVAGGTADGSPGGRGPTVSPPEEAEALPDGGGVGDGSASNGDGSGGANPSSATRGSESPNRDAATVGGDNLVRRAASRDGVERVGPDETAAAVTAAGEGAVHSEGRAMPLKEGSLTGGAAGANNDSCSKGNNGQDDEGEAEDCSICMCPVTGDEDQASLDKCVHAFHFTCIVKWGETTNQCPMCKSRFYVITRLRDDHVKRFRGSRRRRPLDEGGLFAPNGHLGGLLIPEEPEPEGARAVCLHCQDGGAEEQLMLCDGPGCSNAAHTFCCGLEEVPAGDWFCPACQARREEEARRREADSRRDAILQRVWAVDSGSEAEEEEQEDDDGVEEEVGRGQQQQQPLESSGEEGVVTGAGAAGEGSGAAGGRRTRRAAAEAAAAAAITTAVTAGAGAEAIDEGGEVRVSSGDLEAIGLGDSSASSSSSNEEEEEEFHGSDAEGGDAGAGAGPTETRGRTAVGSGVEGSSRPRPHSSASPEARRRSSDGSEDGERLVSVLPGGGGVSGGAAAGGASSSSRRRGNRSNGGAVGRSGRSHDGSGSAAAAAAAPNFWPRVLASATSAMTPRHVFADEEYGQELASSEDEAGPPAGATGVVAQSWADAKLAQQLAQGKNKKDKSKAPSTSKQPPRTATTTRTRPQQRQQPVRGSVSNGQASVGSPVWNGGAASTAASTAALRSTPPPPPQQQQQQQRRPERRVFKRPRMMLTSLPPVLPPPPPPPLTMSSAKRYGGRTGGGGSVGDGGGVAARGGRRAGVGTTTTTPRLPAASDVRLGHSEVQALVQRLRRVALKERERRSRGWAVGGSSARTGVSEGGGGDPKVAVEVEQTMAELRRVAVHGDATTLDVLLSSQLPTVLRLWLEVAPDGGPFLPPPQRASLLKVLMVLPVQKSHLRESGIGKLVVAMAADPGETRDNRELIKQIVRRWSQLVFRTPRELPVSPFSPHNHASPIPRRPAAVDTARYAGAGAGAGAGGAGAGAGGAGAGAGWTTAVRSHRARSLGGEMLWASSSSSPPPAALPRHGTFQGTRGTPPPRGKKLGGGRNGGSSSSSATLRRGGGARAVVRTIPRRHDVSGGTGGGGVKRTIPRLPPQDGNGARGGAGAGGGAATSSLSSPARHAARHRNHHRESASSSRDSASASLVPPTSSSSSSSSSTATSSLPHHRQLHLGGNGGGARASRPRSSFSRPASDGDATPRPQQQRQPPYCSPSRHFPARAANAPGGGGGGGDGGRKRPREASLAATAAAAASHSRTQHSGRQEGGGAENGRGGGGVSREVGGGGGGGAVGVPSRRFDWPAARGPRSG
ncbi:conserved unknown protein [Ectocarpus siliculosus]|uniref:Uncharacterized protein n=1 Tax=Ectocarpus siliculosus TaxID=2880 RepID=D7FVY3_ECTSI|nr:conserved unknown protein [Ectocarpus siliculosus]|eukprot:CBJ25503.1 conserved unknown protein [Ectocarpus siliculosus]